MVFLIRLLCKLCIHPISPAIPFLISSPDNTSGTVPQVKPRQTELTIVRANLTRVTSPPNPTTGGSRLIFFAPFSYFLFIFYLPLYTLPDFSSVSFLASLPFLPCHPNKKKKHQILWLQWECVGGPEMTLWTVTQSWVVVTSPRDVLSVGLPQNDCPLVELWMCLRFFVIVVLSLFSGNKYCCCD